MRLIYSSLPGRVGMTVSSSGAATSKQDLENTEISVTKIRQKQKSVLVLYRFPCVAEETLTSSGWTLGDNE